MRSRAESNTWKQSVKLKRAKYGCVHVTHPQIKGAAAVPPKGHFNYAKHLICVIRFMHCIIMHSKLNGHLNGILGEGLQFAEMTIYCNDSC